ncbi:MAG: hypothetical protein ACLVEU_04405 [Bacteroides cellulosilyticus]
MTSLQWRSPNMTVLDKKGDDDNKTNGNEAGGNTLPITQQHRTASLQEERKSAPTCGKDYRLKVGQGSGT